MGALSNAFGSAGSAANASLQWGNAAAGLTAGGDVLSGVGGFQQASYAAGLASRNAKIAEGNETATLNAGNYEDSAAKLRTGLQVSQEKASQAANGIDVNVGSALKVRQSTQDLGAMDAAMIHYNALRAAYGEQVQVNALKAQAGADRSAALGSLGSGLFKAGGSLLADASSSSARWAGYKLSGAMEAN